MADDSQPVSLWTDPARTRFFLLPDDRQLPPGDFILRTLTGRELKVDPASLTAFELSEEQAKEWLKSEFGKLLDGARSAVDRFVQGLNERAV
jgi:hypothetical protein